MSAKNIYNKDVFIESVVTYLFTHDKEDIESLTFKELYSAIISENPSKTMPKLSQARIYIKDELIDDLDINKNEPITSALVYKLTEAYEYTEDFEYFLSEHKFKSYSDEVIPCIIKLPEKEILDSIASGRVNSFAFNKKNISSSLAKMGIIKDICNIIKKEHADCVIAAIPDFNFCISYKGKSRRKIDNPVDYCTSICLLVINNQEGEEFIQSFSKHIPFADQI